MNALTVTHKFLVGIQLLLCVTEESTTARVSVCDKQFTITGGCINQRVSPDRK